VAGLFSNYFKYLKLILIIFIVAMEVVDVIVGMANKAEVMVSQWVVDMANQ